MKYKYVELDRMHWIILAGCLEVLREVWQQNLTTTLEQISALPLSHEWQLYSQILSLLNDVLASEQVWKIIL